MFLNCLRHPNLKETGPIATPDDQSNAEIDRYFRAAVALRGTQFSLSVGEPPRIEIDGDRESMNRPPISASEMNSLLSQILSASQMTELNDTGELLFERSVERHGKEYRFDVQLHVYEKNIVLLANPI